MYPRKKTPRKYRGRMGLVIFLAAGLSILLAACQPSQPAGTQNAPTPTTAEPTDFPAGFPTPDPDEFTACMEAGGRWEVLGFSGPGCNLPTSDGGKPCLDSKECESGCLGDPELVMITDRYGPPIINHQRMDELNENNDENTGLCSAWQQNFGCQVWVEKGQYAAICVD
jgi:hypothetical protein